MFTLTFDDNHFFWSNETRASVWLGPDYTLGLDSYYPSETSRSFNQCDCSTFRTSIRYTRLMRRTTQLFLISPRSRLRTSGQSLS